MLNYGAPLVHALIDISLQRFPAVIVSTWSDISNSHLGFECDLACETKDQEHSPPFTLYLSQSVSQHLFILTNVKSE